MIKEFITWDSLSSLPVFTIVVYIFVEYTKGLKWVKKIPTRYYSMIVAFVLLVLAQLRLLSISGEAFDWWSLIPYTLNAMAVSLSANGLSSFPKPDVSKVVSSVSKVLKKESNETKDKLE